MVTIQRAKERLPALNYNSSLSTAAFARANELLELFSHTRPDGTSYKTLIIGYNCSAWGENIAAGQSTPEAVMTSWMNSTGHRENILKTTFEDIGVGVYQSGSKLYWVQIFGKE